MTLNEKKLKKGKQLNKRYKTRLNLGTVSYQREEPSSLITNHNLYIREMVEYEHRINKKTKKKDKEVKRSIKIEAKKDVMDGILTEITDKQNKEKDEEDEEDVEDVEKVNKVKKKKKKQVTKTIFIKEVDKTNEGKKKLVITADLKPDGKKGELVL